MEESDVRKIFKELILEINSSFLEKQDTEFLEGLKLLTNSDSIENMIKRFKKLAGIEK